MGLPRRQTEPATTGLRDLSLAECEEVLLRARIGRLGVRCEDGVYIVPVAFAFAEGAIFGHSPPGKKLALLRRWPHVGFQVDEILDLTDWRSVLVEGKWHEVNDETEKEHARAVLLRAFEGNVWRATAGHGHKTSLADAVLYRIDIDDLSGRAQTP